MRPLMQVLLGALLVVVVVLIGGLVYVKATGLRGQPAPGALETRVARAFRSLAIPGDIKSRTNPLAQSEDAFWSGLEHYARYCSVCHANNGSGEKTAFGSGLYPKPPDLRETQDLSDGELFYIIENGVRFTGMPAFGTGTPDEAGERQLWQLVTFVRRLQKLTADEIGRMEALNPL
jgi:mono/diheme cytochrome c family protein